ncbi:MAG: hypothetical protein GEU93_21740 [Propionibacteriales bacterium]|nr:hypothetical protein [Propionibacteriales bacterium]
MFEGDRKVPELGLCLGGEQEACEFVFGIGEGGSRTEVCAGQHYVIEQARPLTRSASIYERHL